MGYFELDPEKLFNTTFFKPLGEERFEFRWVITGLEKIFISAFTFIAISGYSLYLWYLNRHNSNSLLNNLYGFIALDGIFLTAEKFLQSILFEFLEQDHPIMHYVHFLGILLLTFFTLLLISMISAASAIRHFNSPKYLEYSETWSNMKFGSVILFLSVVATICTLIQCVVFENDCVKMRPLFIIVTLPCSLLVIILVTIDDVYGISQIRNRIRSLLFGNFETPVMNINPASEVKVSSKLNVHSTIIAL